MKPFLSLTSRRGLVWVAFALVALDAGAQAAVDAPPAMVPRSCKSLDFDRKTISSPFQFDLLLSVDDAGEVVSVQPLNDMGSNASLLSAVVTATKSCKYFPATSNGKPTSGNVRLVLSIVPEVQTLEANSPAVESLHTCAPTLADYPLESRRMGEEGTTSTRFTVDKKGKVTAFAVTKSSGFLRLDFVAFAKLATCKFKPGTAPDGTTIGGTLTMDYLWKLE
jgi:TonB family protein